MTTAAVNAAGSAAYPSRWEADVVLSDGATMHVRPIKPSDADGIVAMHHRLSAETIYLRFFTPLPNLSPAMLERFVNVDYVDRMALVGELGDSLIGVSRYDRLPAPAGAGPRAGGAEAEVAFLVDDAHQGRGVGMLLLEHLAAAAKDVGICRFVADTLPNNQRMLRVFQDAGFSVERTFADGVVRVTFPIEETEASVQAMNERERRAAAQSVRRLLAPNTVAVIGASRRRGSIGHRLLRNLLEGEFAGPVYPVNPTAHQVGSVLAYPSVLDVPDNIDLAVIVVPAAEVLGVVEACARKRVGGLVVISSGFAERDADGAGFERKVVAEARRNGMRLIGPNGIGVVNTDPQVRLNATFSPIAAPRGRIGFMSQSGGLGVVILDEMARRGLGVSTFVSVGNKADVSSNDMLQYWGGDDNTDIVLLYLEAFGNPRKFARVARLSRRKPIVAVKSGRSPAGTRAASLHTAALAATEASVDALFRQTGVIRVDTLEDLFDVAQVLSSQPLPGGRGVAIIGNAGGPGVLGADAAEAAGLTVPELSLDTQAALQQVVKRGAVVRNPVDLDPEATPADFERALTMVLADKAVDAAIAIFVTPLSPPLDDVAASIARAAATASHKPVLASILGRRLVLGEHGRRTGPAGAPRPAVPSFVFPESAVRALARVADYAEWRIRPEGAIPEFRDVDRAAARLVVNTALDDARAREGVWLDTASAIQLVGAYRVPVMATEHAGSPEDAVAAAAAIGYPVALKAAGVVRLDLASEDEVAAAYGDVESALGADMAGVVVQAMAAPGIETVVEVIQDPLFGPLIAFGTGGMLGELVHDRAFRAMPLTDVDAHELVTSARGASLLAGRLGTAEADVGALQELLLRVGRLVDDVPEVAELALDPVIASVSGSAAVGVRIRLAPWEPHPERALRRLGGST